MSCPSARQYEVHWCDSRNGRVAPCRTVYLNKAGNIARLAASMHEEDLDDLPRIASGEARQLASDSAAGPVGPASQAGLQGTVIKP